MEMLEGLLAAERDSQVGLALRLCILLQQHSGKMRVRAINMQIQVTYHLSINTHVRTVGLAPRLCILLQQHSGNAYC